MASSRAALWAAAVDGGFSKGEAFVSQMPDGKNPENPGFSWALFETSFVVSPRSAIPGRGACIYLKTSVVPHSAVDPETHAETGKGATRVSCFIP